MQIVETIDVKEAELFYESNRSRLFKGKSQKGDFILLKDDITGEKGRLFNEAMLTEKVAFHDLNPQVLIYEGRQVIVRKFIPGKSLNKLIPKNGLELEDFLVLSIEVCKELARVHDKGLLHNDINPKNFIINLKSKKATLIDYEFATSMSSQSLVYDSKLKITGTADYISPEQTGRMNRKIDQRSDLYGLGASFYEMITGHPPFQSDDFVGMIHAHLAVTPKAPSIRRDSILPALDQIILKLLSKNAEDRYQTLNGLIHDLEFCKKYLDRADQLLEFAPGKVDASSKFLVSQKLFGREIQIKTLKDAFERANHREKEFCIVRGESGAGKSELCKELYKKISLTNGLFISGSFDVMDRQSPYLGFIRAFEQFSDWLITSNSENQKKWKDAFDRHLGGFGQVLVELAPKLKHTLGNQADLLPLSGVENQQRIQFAINSFLETITSTEQSIVLYLDDFQWANDASIDLLSSILKNENLSNILILITFRSNEVDDSHPLHKCISEAVVFAKETNDFQTSIIDVPPLNKTNLAKLVTETLREEVSEKSELITLLHKKTKGNPFAVNKLLESFYERQLIRFDHASSKWIWDLDDLNDTDLSDDILDILHSKIKSLNSESLEIIKKASVFGSEFRLDNLALASKMGEAEVHHLLWPLIQEGTILPKTNDYKFLPEFYAENGQNVTFKFAHARIQQAIYSLVNEEDKKRLNYEIGEILIKKIDQNEIGERAIELGSHFLLGESHVASSPNLNQIGKLLLKAGEQSTEAAAFETALKFDLLGKKLLKSILSEEETFEVSIRSLENAFLSGDLELKEKLQQKILSEFPSKEHRLLTFEVIIRCLAFQNNPKEAVNLTYQALKEVGMSLPKKASVPQILFGLIKMGIKLPSKKFDSLTSLPTTEDREFIALSKVLYSSFPAFLFSNPQTYPLVILKLLELTLKNGLSQESPSAIASYGLILITAMKQPQNGYEIIQKAMELSKSAGQDKNIATVYMVYVAFASYIHDKPEQCYSYFEEGFLNGVEFGNMEYASWNIFFKATLHFHEGKRISQILEAARRAKRFASLYNFQNQVSMMALTEKSILIQQMSHSKALEKFSEWVENPGKEVLKAQKEENEVFLYTYYGDAGNAALWIGKNEEAFENYELFKTYTKNQPRGFFIIYEEFNRALNAAILVHKNGKWSHNGVSLKSIIKDQLKALEKFRKLNKYPFEAFYLFLKNYFQFLRDKEIDQSEFDQSITILKEIENHRYQTLFGEILSELAESDKEKESFLNHAIHSARKMEATGKVEELLGITQDKNMKRAIFQNLESNTRSSSSFEYSSIDTMTLIKSMEALVGEIKLEPLLEKLLTFAMENSGAQEGHFIVNGSNGWVVEVSAKTSTEIVTNFPHEELSESNEVSQSIINYAKGTKESLLVADALNTPPYSSDPLVKSKNIRSVLCIPFINQSKSSGIIYLTHSESPDAFQKENINLMRLMAGQIASIIENALLYQNMENLVKERTAQLEMEKKKSDALLLNILPKEIADELIENGQAKARHHDSVSVMFVDIKDFTSIAERMAPDELVETLHEFFGSFDAIMLKYGLEKIKTIGDAYMAAGGVPSPSQNHHTNIILAAFEILRNADELNKVHNKSKQPMFHIRIGIHIGPVVAGVVGNNKFAYDIWGDTVNIASRMESNSSPGRINISEDLYQLIKDDFDCEHRGELEVKNKGMMNMYFVNHPKRI